MRFALLLLCLAAIGGCGSDGLPVDGDMPMSDGGGGGGSGGGGGGAMWGDIAGISCNMPCNRCVLGVCCGTQCCAAGEWCDPNTFTCHCGSGPACANGQTCSRGGPIIEGYCGNICCGNGVVCPL
jgi:hypothetical protein